MSEQSKSYCYDLSGIHLVKRIVKELEDEGYTLYSFMEYYEAVHTYPWSRERTPEDIKGRASLMECFKRNIENESRLDGSNDQTIK